MKSLFLLLLSLALNFTQINGEVEKRTEADKMNGEQLFRPIITTFAEHPDLDETHKILKVLNGKALPGVAFDRPITNYQDLSIGSAMALDFVARYLNECSHLDVDKISPCIKSFERYYSVEATSIFSARDFAFKHFNFFGHEHVSAEEFKYIKMQSIANYHCLILDPITKSLKKNKFKKIHLKKIIENLPSGAYVINAIYPYYPDEEVDEHTMILIKTRTFSVFYERHHGAAQINQKSGKQIFKIGTYVEDFLLELPISEIKIYKADCGEGKCTNLLN